MNTLLVEWAALAAITGAAWLVIVKPPWLHDDKNQSSAKIQPTARQPEELK